MKLKVPTVIREGYKRGLLITAATAALIWGAIQLVWTLFVYASPTFLGWVFLTPTVVIATIQILTAVAVIAGVALYLVYTRVPKSLIQPESVIRPVPTSTTQKPEPEIIVPSRA